MDESTQMVLDTVDQQIAGLSLEQCADYLENLIMDLEMRLDGIKSDIRQAERKAN